MTHEVAARIDEDVLPGRTELPHISDKPDQELRDVVEAGAHEWHRRVTPDLSARLRFELERIARLRYSSHFLFVVSTSSLPLGQKPKRSSPPCRGLSGGGRTTVMYCLGISRIDAFTHDLHFDRFLPDDGSSKPDIDIDFEARRRQDIHRYLIDRYGLDQVAGIAAIGTFRTRGILREVGKALGMDDAMIGFIAKKLHGRYLARRFV